ncbi:MAG: pal [Rickettsiales bacterium]|jgi:peptidoglycan-associated lipoprotein|nr:pal [Rickettsiales bacterium]
MVRKIFALVLVTFIAAACSSSDKGGLLSGDKDGSRDGSMSGNVSVTPGSQEDLVVNVGDRVFFAFDSAVVSSEGQSTLSRQATWLAKYPKLSITIEGHCDERGTREYNIALGERRAAAVKNFLVSSGVSADRVAVISYGKERPEVLGSNEDAWTQNRRGVTVLN